MLKKITLFLLLCSITTLVTAQKKIPTFYYKGKDARTKRSITVISKDADKVFVTFNNSRVTSLWNKKTAKEVNQTYKNKPGILDFSYSKGSGNVKLVAALATIKEILRKEFRFTDNEITAQGL